MQRICCCQSRPGIENCSVLQDARSCSCLLSCQYLILGKSRCKINVHHHTAKSTSSFQEEMAHLPAATTATSTPTTPEHTDYGRRLVAHAVELCLGESSYSVQIICPDASRSLNFLIRRTRECCASQSVREADTKNWLQKESTRAFVFWRWFCAMDRRSSFLLPCTRSNLCRMCLRILICGSERALGADPLEP